MLAWVNSCCNVIIDYMRNRDVAHIFETVADMLAIRGDNIHRVLAYRRAAESIRELGRDLNTIRMEGELESLPGVGKTLATKIEELLETERLDFYDRLSQEIPPSLVGLLRVEGVGPKRARLLYEQLGIEDIGQLSAAATEGKLRHLQGMGAKSEARIIAGIASLARHGDDRIPLGVAWPVAQEILESLRGLPNVKKVSIAGSLRRFKETIGDIDILLAADNPTPIMKAFRELPVVESVLGSGTTKTSVILLNGLQVDLRILPEQRWGTLLSYFTGSKEHNVRLREQALKVGYSLNEHSLTPLEGGKELQLATEEEVYQALGMSFVPPPLRENQGEIERALEHNMPELVSEEDVRADLHVHSTWSDGKMSILDMAQAAKDRGLSYIVIADHSESLGIANGLSVERVREQASEIRAADIEMGPGFRVLHGTEMEIRADGSLDFPDDLLDELDVVIASLHVSLSQDRKEITSRLLRAIENPHVDLIGHPTGRLIADRPAADLDMEVILHAAARTGTLLEINANPQRLDLKDSHVKRAIDLGAKLAINTDAHHADQFDLMHFGVSTAQRGWAETDHIVNCWPVEKLMTYVEERSG